MKTQSCKRWVILCVVATAAFILSLQVLPKSGLHEDFERGLREYEQTVVQASNTTSETEPQEEKYMMFYPHSGLHNQRLSLLNAAMVAGWLNRTLIIPEVNIATATYWRSSVDLPNKLDFCPDMVAGHRQMEKELGQRVHLPSECFDYRKYVPVRFTDLFDLSALETVGVRYILRDDLHHSYFQHEPLSIPQNETNQTMVYKVLDDDRYSYRIYDSDDNDQPLFNFNRRLTVSELQARPERVLIFNSMFGSKRLALNDKNKKQLEFLRQSISILHPIVDSGADQVISKLGGRGQYVSAHIRTGDGVFKQHITETMNKIKAKLDGLVREDSNIKDTEVEQLRMLQLQKTPQSISKLLDRCVQLQSEGGKLTTLFMATDSKDPRNDPNLRTIFDDYVCSFTLQDFPDAAKSIKATSPRDNNTQIGPLLLPLVDAVIASYGKDFVGTQGSTFSGYVKSRQLALIDRHQSTI
ncbi:hypothetical protein NQZ79_g3009 [Umbelopsis isabellina]|nr:hypothetical protein NQZ79_g3009 [Umbelopsis isabellina]